MLPNLDTRTGLLSKKKLPFMRIFKISSSDSDCSVTDHRLDFLNNQGCGSALFVADQDPAVLLKTDPASQDL